MGIAYEMGKLMAKRSGEEVPATGLAAVMANPALQSPAMREGPTGPGPTGPGLKAFMNPALQSPAMRAGPTGPGPTGPGLKARPPRKPIGALGSTLGGLSGLSALRGNNVRAQPSKQLVKSSAIDWKSLLPMLLPALMGGGAGFLTSSRGNGLRDALLGALAGGGLGYGANRMGWIPSDVKDQLATTFGVGAPAANTANTAPAAGTAPTGGFSVGDNAATLAGAGGALGAGAGGVLGARRGGRNAANAATTQYRNERKQIRTDLQNDMYARDQMAARRPVPGRSVADQQAVRQRNLGKLDTRIAQSGQALKEVETGAPARIAKARRGGRIRGGLRGATGVGLIGVGMGAMSGPSE